MKINDIDPNKAVNLGLTNLYNIRIRQLSGSLYFILKNRVYRTSYSSFRTEKSKCIYTYDRSRRQIKCGLTLLMMALQVVKPHLFTNHRSKESKMEDINI